MKKEVKEMPTLKQSLEELRKIDVDPDEPPAPKRIEKTITNLPPKINRVPKGMKEGTSRLNRISKT